MTEQKTPPPNPTPTAKTSPKAIERYPDTFIDGVLVGLLVGAALVLWFSPQNGRGLFDNVKKYLPDVNIGNIKKGG